MNAYLQYSSSSFISGYFIEFTGISPLWSTEKEEATIMSEDKARQVFDKLDNLGWGDVELVLFKSED